MSEVVFARPRHDYQSYTDLYSLIQLAGYPLIFADEIDPHSDNTYIVTIYSGETENGWPGATADIRLWDFEWHMDGLPPIPGVAEIWSPDAYVARRLGWRYVPLGSDERLNPEPDAGCPKHYDVALLAYMGPPRRQQVQRALLQRGITVGPNGWGQERHEVLLQTRAMVHVHQHDHIPTVAAQRVALAAAYRLPYFTEQVADAGIFANTPWFMSDYAHLPEFVAMWLREGRDEGRLKDTGQALYRRLCIDHSFRACVERAL